jgi:hypothetical protein
MRVELPDAADRRSLGASADPERWAEQGVDCNDDDPTPGSYPLPESRCGARVAVSLVRTRRAGAVPLLLIRPDRRLAYARRGRSA